MPPRIPEGAQSSNIPINGELKMTYEQLANKWTTLFSQYGQGATRVFLS